MTRDPVIIVYCIVIAWLAVAAVRQVQFEHGLDTIERTGVINILKQAGILE